MRAALLRIHRFLLPARLRLGWTPYAWLAYTGFLFFPFLFGGGSATILAWTVATLLVFLPLYFLGFRSTGLCARLVVLAILALGVLTATFNTGASVYFIYACSFSAFLGPPRVAVRYLGIIVLTAALAAWFLELSPAFLVITLIVGLMVGLSNMYWRQMDIKNNEVRASQEEVRRLAATAERERIARDLHDLLGHTLASVALKAELARRLMERDPDAARAELRDVERIARTATAEVRQAVSGYRACSISGECVRGRRHLEDQGIEVTVALPPDLTVAPELDNVLGLVLREGLTNVARHARAGSCRVRVEALEGGVSLIIEDDGIGGASLAVGTGLRGMRERLELVGGRLQVERSAMGGTRLEAHVPDREGPVPVPGSALQAAPW